MTTQKQQPQTPYDAEIAKEEENRGSVGYLEYLRGARMGHLLAKAEDADLLAACEAALALLNKQRDEYNADATLAYRPDMRESPIVQALRAAIAKAKGEA